VDVCVGDVCVCVDVECLWVCM